MSQLHQSTGIGTGIFDALDQLQWTTENSLVRRLRKDTGGGLRAQIENLSEVAIAAHPAFTDQRRRTHGSSSEPRNPIIHRPKTDFRPLALVIVRASPNYNRGLVLPLIPAALRARRLTDPRADGSINNFSESCLTPAVKETKTEHSSPGDLQPLSTHSSITPGGKTHHQCSPAVVVSDGRSLRNISPAWSPSPPR